MRTIQPHGFSQRHPTFAMVCLAGLLALCLLVPPLALYGISFIKPLYQNARHLLNCEDVTRGLSSLGACDSSDVCL